MSIYQINTDIINKKFYFNGKVVSHLKTKNSKSFLIQPCLEIICSNNEDIFFEGYCVPETSYGPLIYINLSAYKLGLSIIRNTIAHEALHIWDNELAHSGNTNHPEIVVTNEVIKRVLRLPYIETIELEFNGDQY